MNKSNHQNGEEYQSIFENALEGIFQSCADGHYLKVNPAMARIYGYESPEDMVTSVIDISKQIHVDEESRKQFLEELTKHGHVDGFEARNYRKDRSIIWTQTNARGVRDNKGNIKYFEGFLTDITSRKEAEFALRESEEQFKKLFQANPIASCIATLKEGRFIAANEAYWILSGYKPNELLGRTSVELGFITETRRKKVVSRLKKAKSLRDEGGKLFTKSGEIRNTIEFFDLIRFDGQACILSMFYDITDQVEAKAALKENEEKYRQLFEAESDAIFLIDNESGNILEVNAAATALYGYSKKELLRKKNSDLSAESEETNKITRKTPINREQVIEIPLRFHKKKDGIVFPVEITGRFFEWRGRPVHIAAIRDITNRKNAEEALRASEERFRLSFQTSPDSININRLEDGLYIDINEGFTSITGYTREDAIGKTSLEINIWDNPKDRANLVDRLKKNGFVDNLEAKFRMKNGRVITGLMSARIIMLDDAPHIISITREIENIKLAEETLQRQLEELSILHNIALAASSSKSVNELIQRATDTIGDSLYPDNCGVELLTESGDMLVPHPSYRGATNDVIRKHMHISQGVTGKVASTGTPIRLGDVGQEPAYIEATVGVQSELCVPIKMQDRVIGVINVESKKTDAFSETDERLLNTIAGTMATAIEQLRLFETSQRRLQELTILNAVSLASTEAISVDELIEKITQIIGESLYPDNFGVLLINEEGTAIYPHPSYRGIADGKFPTSVHLGEGISGQVASTGKPLRIANVRKQKKYIEVTSQVRSELCVPIAHGDRILGAINAESLKIDMFTEADEQLLTTIASTLATAMEKLRLLEAEKKRRQNAETLREATVALTTSLDLIPLLESVMDSLFKILPYDSASIAMERDGEMEIIAGRGFPENFDAIGKFLPTDGKWKQLVADRQPMIVADVHDDPSFVQWEGSEYIRGWMGVPLVVHDKSIGAIYLDSRKANAFSEKDAVHAQTLINSAAVTIENARLFEAEQQSRERAEALHEATAALTTSIELEELYEIILDSLSKLIPYDSASIELVNQQYLEIVAENNLPIDHPFIGYKFVYEPKKWKKTVSERWPLIIPNVQIDERFEKLEGTEYIRSWMGVPMFAQDRLIGFLNLDSREVSFYTQEHAALAQTFGNQAAIALENARLFERGERQIRQLTVLRDIDSAISSSFDLRVVLNLLLEHAIGVLEADAAVILLYDPDLHSLSPQTNIGFLNKRSAYWSEQFRIGEGLAGSVVLQRKLVHVSDLHNTPEFTQSSYSSDEGFKSYFGIPLIGKGLIKGVLEIYTKKESHPKQDWFDFLHTLAGQAAIAIDNVQLFKKLQRSSQELILAYDATLAGWGQALELRDKETQGHSDRVVEHTIELARRIGVEGEELTHIMRGTLLHDIGKMGIPDHILHKPGTLTEEEWEVMRQHPQLAFDLMSRIPYLRPATDIPYAHHERWDGSGYPRGLKEEEIPLAARIFAVVDIWDALLYDRVYRDAWPEEKVLEYLKNTAGIELDPNIVEKFLELLEDENRFQKRAG